MSAVSYLLRLTISGYQRYISSNFGRRCKYYPTCSDYAMRALDTHGAIKGIMLSVWRFARCNPLSDGGVDYPPLPGEWAAAPYRQMPDEELQKHWDSLDAEVCRMQGAQ